MEQVENRITLRGTLAELPVFSHENHGKQFYRFALHVPRLSSNVDILPVIAPRFWAESIPARLDMSLRITGQIRSHNLRTDGRRHLSVFVFASQLEPEDGEAINQVELEGILCREPTYRRTPLGRQICDVMLAVPRAFRRTDFCPASSGAPPLRRAPAAIPGTGSGSWAASRAEPTPSRPRRGPSRKPPTKYRR